MDIALWYKFTQHTDLKQELLGTGDAELIEVSGLCDSEPRLSLTIPRIPIRMHFGGSGQMAKVGTNWERP